MIEVHWAILLAVVAGATILTVVLIKLLDRLRLKDAESKAAAILAETEQKRSTRLREAELEIKEKSLQEKTAVEKELAKTRHEMHERERSLDKRQDLLDQQGEHLQKQEKMVESTQRKLAEK